MWTRIVGIGLWALTVATAAAAQNTAGVGQIRGVVLTAAKAPAPDVAVCVVGTGRCAVTDPTGRFVVADLRAGTYGLEILAPGRPLVTVAGVDVRAGLDAVVEFTLPPAQTLETAVTVTAPRFVVADAVKTSAFLVSSAEVAQAAGALQDVSRYVQALPGVVIGTDDFRNDLIVRGGSPLENLFIVDNIEIPNINTFATFASAGGSVSILDAFMLQDVTFLTGGFPAAYGNRTSSVLQIAQREGNREEVRGRATLGFAGAGGVVEGPIGRGGRGAWIASFRRSFVDVFTDDIGIGGVPVLYTLNGKLTFDLSPRDRIWAVNVSGFDRIRLGLTEDADLTSELANLDITYRGGRSASGVNWQRAFGSRGVGLFGISHARAWVRQEVRDLLRDGPPPPGTSVADQLASGETVFFEDSSESETTIKYDLTVSVPVVGRVQAGGSLKRLAIDYDTASPFGSDGPYLAEPDQNPFAVRERTATRLGSVYLQVSRDLAPRLDLTAGGRVDRFTYLDATRVSPRVGLSYALTSSVSLTASAGRYFQQPFFLFLTAFPGNRALRPFRADHVVAGLAWVASDRTRVTVEAYRKEYADYPVSTQVAALSLANIGDTFAVRDVLFPMESAGTGRATGIELFAERKAAPGARWYGQANVAISRARYAGRDGVLRPGSFDYPIVFNLAGSYRLGGRWDLSIRAAYLGGRPFTPFDLERSAAQRRAVYDVTRVNAERGPAYVRLDVRVDRALTVAGRPFVFFAGAQNVTDRRNVAGYGWDRRQNLPKINTQQGLFPIAGLEWRF